MRLFRKNDATREYEKMGFDREEAEELSLWNDDDEKNDRRGLRIAVAGCLAVCALALMAVSFYVGGGYADVQAMSLAGELLTKDSYKDNSKTEKADTKENPSAKTTQADGRKNTVKEEEKTDEGVDTSKQTEEEAVEKQEPKAEVSGEVKGNPATEEKNDPKTAGQEAETTQPETPQTQEAQETPVEPQQGQSETASEQVQATQNTQQQEPQETASGTPAISEAIMNKYYKGCTAEQAAQAEAVAMEIAGQIRAWNGESNLDEVWAAAQMVAAYARNSRYENDANGYYATPYGVFVGGVYTCAGTTRALGRVLDYLGYSWQHANENQWSHQWCIVTNMDGQVGFADGMAGVAGYGEMTSGMSINGGYLIF